MQNSIKYIIKTDDGKTYILHIMETAEFNARQYVGLFLFHNEEYAPEHVKAQAAV